MGHGSKDNVKRINLKEWPFGVLVTLSLVMSLLHALIQLKWTVIRYRSFGPRPASAQMFIGLEVLLLMVILTVGMIHASNEKRTESNVPYYLGITAAIGAWIVVSFAI